jgi:hypothetical protein
VDVVEGDQRHRAAQPITAGRGGQLSADRATAGAAATLPA